ncbi:DUF2971 domain-containing protein [Pseudomonas moraviensis subsp. stanleyae]|uniref:DUF2971 domain-containing protein n=1 Tax=Pseudomonas moraviensis TaxID=321662 RepID=UPI002E37C88D|nr:DUF2971 domain-containing protein [Pseudomonas moraviensis]MED7670229.1 DUF2971 domain-containing protein [Pseudomonas moraviensis subsp. stanleyae]
MGLYKYVTADTAKKILKGSIRFTQPKAFNDPFELLPQFIVPESTQEHVGSFKFCVISPRRKGLDRSHTPGDDQFRSDINARDIAAKLNSTLGILCLSRNIDSLLMWGHYAGEYSGAVIEFDEGHDFFTGLNPVKYQKRRPIFNLSDFYDQPVPIADLCVKSNSWSYEKEVRLVRSAEDLTDTGKAVNGYPVLTLGIPLECIKAVYIGERMSLENQKELWGLVRNTNISLSLAAVANWDYSFRYELIKYPGPLTTSPIISPRTAHIFKDDPSQFGEMARWIIENHKMSAFVNKIC